MKGICGYWNLDRMPGEAATAMRMADRLRRNGLGHSACWQEGSLALGQAIWFPLTSLQAPAQPFSDSASGCVVVADARLDQAAGSFNDTCSLIIQCWLRWGEACAEHLEGEFAFALWDPRRNVLHCARDRLGVRPFYFHHSPGRFFAFASGCEAVLAHPRVPKAVDEGRIADFLVPVLEGVDKTSTFFQGIERLAPAHSMTITPDGRRRARFWTLHELPSATLPSGDDDWASALGEALERAVGFHLDSPETVGCMVSGGLDSSSLAVIARDQLLARGRGPLPTFSAIDRTASACAETRAIDAMLALPGIDATVVDRADIASLGPELLGAILDSEEPFDIGMSLLNTQYLRAAARGVGVVMDGIDADTLFADGASTIRWLRGGHWLTALRNANAIDRNFPTAGFQLPSILLAARSAITPRPVRRIMNARRRKGETSTRVKESLIEPDFARRANLAGRLERLSRHRSIDPHVQPATEAREALDHPYLTVGLERYHRVAARHGIEARHPFADRRLVELCANLPDRQRFRDGLTKPVLRHAMRGRLPEPVRCRTDKQHLGWSVTQALLMDRKPDVLESLRLNHDRLAPYLNVGMLEARVTQFQAGCADESDADILQALGLGSWLARHS